MAQTKALLDPVNDISKMETLLHEAIPITGSLLTGTYAEPASRQSHIQTYAHGMFQSVYDYPYLSSSANHILDITVGYNRSLSGTAGARDNVTAPLTAQGDKHAIYDQLAFQHVPLDLSGNIGKFDRDGSISDGGTKMEQLVFLNFAKLLVKDEIKRGSFQMTLGLTSSFDVNVAGESKGGSGGLVILTDQEAAGTTGSYFTTSPAGEFGLLRARHVDNDPGGILEGKGFPMAADSVGSVVGHIYYQTGLVAVTSSLFMSGTLSSSCTMIANPSTTAGTMFAILTGSSIDTIANAVRHRINNIKFNNTTKLYSTVYFLRANHRQFNYSTNPTYVSGGQIVNKVNASDLPYAYITTVGLYSSDNELMAVGKFSEPIFKDPTTELVIKARIDY